MCYTPLPPLGGSLWSRKWTPSPCRPKFNVVVETTEKVMSTHVDARSEEVYYNFYISFADVQDAWAGKNVHVLLSKVGAYKMFYWDIKQVGPDMELKSELQSSLYMYTFRKYIVLNVLQVKYRAIYVSFGKTITICCLKCLHSSSMHQWQSWCVSTIGTMSTIWKGRSSRVKVLIYKMNFMNLLSDSD